MDGKINAQQAKQKMVEASSAQIEVGPKLDDAPLIRATSPRMSCIEFGLWRMLTRPTRDTRSFIESQVSPKGNDHDCTWNNPDSKRGVTAMLCLQDGFLTLPEYAIAMHLVQMKLDGQDWGRRPSHEMPVSGWRSCASPQRTKLIGKCCFVGLCRAALLRLPGVQWQCCSRTKSACFLSQHTSLPLCLTPSDPTLMQCLSEVLKKCALRQGSALAPWVRVWQQWSMYSSSSYISYSESSTNIPCAPHRSSLSGHELITEVKNKVFQCCKGHRQFARLVRTPIA